MKMVLMNRDKNKFIKILIVVLFCVFAMVIRGEVNVIKSLWLVLAHFFFLYLPGRAILKSTQIRFGSNLVAFLCSYAAGYVMSIILYIALLLIGIQKYSLYPALAMSVISLWPLYKRREEEDFITYAGKEDYIIFFGFLAATIIVGITIYVLPNRSAQIIGYQDTMGDLTYWYKNCVASTKGYPLPELSVTGLNLYWHLFSCFEVAFLHFVTGIEIYNLCFTFSFIWKMILLVGGTYVLAAHYLKKRKYVALVLLVTLFTSGLDTQTVVDYQDHLFRCSLAFEEGYAMSMFGLVFFDKFLEMEKKTINAYLLTMIGFAGALGLKVSGGTLLLAGIGGRLLFELRKDWRRLIRIALLISSYIMAYLIVSKLFIIDGNALSSSTSSHQMAFSPFKTIFRSGYYEPIYQTLKTGFINKYLAYIITVGIYLLQSDYAVSIPFVLSILAVCISGKGRFLFTKRSLPLLAMVACGQVLFIFLNHPGFSQVYFYFNTFAFASVVSMLLVEECSADIVIEKNLARGISIITLVMALASIKYNIVNYHDIYVLDPQIFSVKEPRPSTGQNDVSSLEMDGLRWIRDNLPEDIILATNKVFSGNPESSSFSRTFITSEYSERQVYLEGFSSTNLPDMQFVMERLSELRMYYGGEQGAEEILKNKGVTHAVVFKGLQDPSVIPAGSILFENNNITVIDIGK